MFDLSTIDPEIIRARGEYATVRGAHEDAKKKLAGLCGKLSSVSSQILRKMQPDNDGVPEGYQELVDSIACEISNIADCVVEIESLAKQRSEIKRKAWS